MLPHEPDQGAVASASVQHVVEGQPRGDVRTEAAAPAALGGVPALCPGLIVDLLPGRHSDRVRAGRMGQDRPGKPKGGTSDALSS